VGQVGVGEQPGVADPVGYTRIVRLVKQASLRLLVEVGRDVIAGEDALEVVGEQVPLGAVTAGEEVHDPPL
jgi:hypothetical protein